MTTKTDSEPVLYEWVQFFTFSVASLAIGCQRYEERGFTTEAFTIAALGWTTASGSMVAFGCRPVVQS